MNTTLKNGLVAALVALVVAFGVISLFGGKSTVSSNAGSTNLTSGVSHFNALETDNGIQIGKNSPSSLGALFSGTCDILAYSNTIAASSTGSVDCSANGGFSAIPGVLVGDTIDVGATSSIPVTFGGLDVIASYSSSTPGYITIRIFNQTGATFTWAATASTSYNFTDLR